MHDIILHHYPQSPVAEKVRVLLGIKGLAWRSVEIPRLPPKPDLVALTGGYRRTPVLQIGADVYCDSQCIARELERRFPEPTLFPGGAEGMAWGVSRWTDGVLFEQAVALVMGSELERLPAEFLEDRGRLYFGSPERLRALAGELPHLLSQVRAQLGWMDERLATGRPFMLGEAPGLPDALAYHLVWFLRGRYAGGPALIEALPALAAWERRVGEIGHGRSEPMSAAEALEVARAGGSEGGTEVDPDDPLGLVAGQRVAVTPEGAGADPAVEGELARLTRDEVALRRADPRAGDVAVHFPRVGYRIERA